MRSRDQAPDEELPPLDDPPPGFEEWAQESGGRGNAAASAIKVHWHRDAAGLPERQWLVRNLVPEVGKGLLSGQWGSAKTFIALDLCASVMAGEPFAGRKVLRRGGCLFIAPEGAFEIPLRLKGLALARFSASQPAGLDPEDLPFAWIEECPRLVDREAGDSLVEIAEEVAVDMLDTYGLPLALIVVDTVAAGAGFDDENSAAETQKVMSALERIGQSAGAFVLGVDHFGKATETGTRGSSAKEAAADVVLAALAQRDEAGNISKTRMAVRKVRGAPTGMETPYALEVVAIGDDRFGEPVTTCTIAWDTNGTGQAAAAAGRDRWPTSLRVFQVAMMAALTEKGERKRPFGQEGPEVLTIREAEVRAEFAAAYPADGDTEKHRAEAKKKAFGRALKGAMSRSLVASRDIGGIDHLWFTGTEDGRDTQGDRTGHL